MKKQLLLSFIASAFVQLAVCQPVIQYNDVSYNAGESYVIHLCDWESAGGSGANQTWDFSGLTSNGTATVDVLNASSTPSGSAFSAANIALYVPADGTYNYFNTNSSELIYFGVAVTGVNIAYANPSTFYTYPLEYMDSNTDNFNSTFMSSGYSWTRTGNISTSVDGYGTVITPAGTFTDVLRVKIEEDYTDTPAGIPQTSNTTTEVYHWYKAGIHYPVLVNTTFTSNGFPQYLLQYTDVSTGIEESENIQVSVYPNPTTDVLNVVNTDFTNGTFEVIDLVGKTVLQGAHRNGKIDANALPNGIYVLRLVSNNGETGVTKFQVSK